MLRYFYFGVPKPKIQQRFFKEIEENMAEILDRSFFYFFKYFLMRIF
jgi:hypothetical protein